METSTLIKVKYSGELDQTGQYVNIGVQTVSILIAGIVLWKGSNYLFNRKLQERNQRKRFETRFSSHWKNR
jgi:hypothetical protein